MVFYTCCMSLTHKGFALPIVLLVLLTITGVGIATYTLTQSPDVAETTAPTPLVQVEPTATATTPNKPTKAEPQPEPATQPPAATKKAPTSTTNVVKPTTAPAATLPPVDTTTTTPRAHLLTLGKELANCKTKECALALWTREHTRTSTEPLHNKLQQCLTALTEGNAPEDKEAYILETFIDLISCPTSMDVPEDASPCYTPLLDKCNRSLGEKTLDARYCAEVGDPKMHDSCIVEIAEETVSLELCEQTVTENGKNSCQMYVISSLAQDDKCSTVKDTGLRNMCTELREGQ